MNGFDESDGFEAAAALPLSARAMARPAMPYLDGLNPEQKQAVETLDGPVLMLAGAGTGKTKALTARIAHLLATGRARPHNVLAVTFTNKAAREIVHRVGKLTQQSVHDGPASKIVGMPWLGTFHFLSSKILRSHAELAGLKSNFTILDKDDQIRLIRKIITAEGIDQKRWTDRWFAAIVENFKNRGWRPETVPESEDKVVYAVSTLGKSQNEDTSGTRRSVIEVYRQYQTRLVALNAVDFGDLLLHVVTIFQQHPDVLASYQQKFRYILVDEYQDTNVAQYLWLRLLAAGHKNICCVGDDDQSIYGWRGAEVGNILRFEKDFPGAHVVRLEQNYRSTPHILAAASAVINGNANRLGKTLWTAHEDGEKVRLIGHWDGEDEARWVGEEIEAMQQGTRGMDPYALSDMAILVRASHQMRAFEDRFLTIGLPYRVIGGPRFYERLEIRDAMAYFRVVCSPDDDLALERIINTPKRGLGEKAIQTIQRLSRDNGVSMLDGARIAIDSGLSGKGRQSLSELIDALDRWRGQMLADELSHIELAEIILEESGYTDFWKNDKNIDAQGRLDNLKELVKALEKFENLQGFLEHIALIMDNDSDDGSAKVSIMTLHGAKGLEFPAVFLPGWEDGLFPSQRSMDESGLKGLEEERRLAYVGITRAEEVCTISFAANRRTYGQMQSTLPSRFIDELPPEHVEVLTPPGLYGGSFGAAAPRERAGGFEGVIKASEMEDRVAKASSYNSPGWARMQQRSTRSIRQPTEARNMIVDAEAVEIHAVGARVFHQKFGYGTVTGVEGNKLAIDFEKAGPKHVVASFVTADDVPF